MEQAPFANPPGLRWSVIASLSATGAVLAAGVVLGWFQSTGSELVAWVVLGLAWVAIVVYMDLHKPFLTVFLVAIGAGIVFGVGPGLFYDVWLANNPQVAAQIDTTQPAGLTRAYVFLTSLGYGLVWGGVLGGVAAGVARWKHRPAKPEAVDA